jgi:hypothetical protein
MPGSLGLRPTVCLEVIALVASSCGYYRVTGCEFSAAQELLVAATEEGNSSMRESCGQKNTEVSGAQPGIKCR